MEPPSLEKKQQEVQTLEKSYKQSTAALSLYQVLIEPEKLTYDQSDSEHGSPP